MVKDENLEEHQVNKLKNLRQLVNVSIERNLQYEKESSILDRTPKYSSTDSEEDDEYYPVAKTRKSF